MMFYVLLNYIKHHYSYVKYVLITINTLKDTRLYQLLFQIILI